MINVGRVVLQEGTYNFYCVPKGLHHHCYFTAGVYEFVHLDMQKELLPNIDFHPKCSHALRHYFADPVKNGKQLPPFSITPVIRNILHDIIDCNLTEQPHFDAFMAHKASCLQFEFSRQLKMENRKVPADFYERQVEKLVKYIEGHLSERLMIKDLVVMARMSPKTLKKYFYAIMKTELTLYILSRRMNHAHHLLRTTNESIGNIADLLGYSETSNMARDYRKHYGCSPKEERRK